tara:strand:+ start:852 stop:1067 length:216 start_codon:yes stop_codon:yes gene_type:complete
MPNMFQQKKMNRKIIHFLENIDFILNLIFPSNIHKNIMSARTIFVAATDTGIVIPNKTKSDCNMLLALYRI